MQLTTQVYKKNLHAHTHTHTHTHRIFDYMSFPLQVLWYQDGKLIDLSDRHSLKVRGNKHILTLHGVRLPDFGNFSCVAENSLGSTVGYIQLSGNHTYLTVCWSVNENLL